MVTFVLRKDSGIVGITFISLLVSMPGMHGPFLFSSIQEVTKSELEPYPFPIGAIYLMYMHCLTVGKMFKGTSKEDWLGSSLIS